MTIDSSETERWTREADWLRNAQAGSSSSLGELLDSYRDYLTLIADEELGLDLKVKASPSDLVQDSCLEATRDFGQFTGKTPAEFQAWLRKVLLCNLANVRRDFRDTEKRDLSREVGLSQSGRGGAIAGGDLTASAVAMKNEQLNAVQAATRKLPQHYQDVIHWRNYERESFEEIGQRLQRSAEAVRKIWVRALEALEQELDLGTDSGKQP